MKVLASTVSSPLLKNDLASKFHFSELLFLRMMSSILDLRHFYMVRQALLFLRIIYDFKTQILTLIMMRTRMLGSFISLRHVIFHDFKLISAFI